MSPGSQSAVPVVTGVLSRAHFISANSFSISSISVFSSPLPLTSLGGGVSQKLPKDNLLMLSLLHPSVPRRPLPPAIRPSLSFHNIYSSSMLTHLSGLCLPFTFLPFHPQSYGLAQLLWPVHPHYRPHVIQLEASKDDVDASELFMDGYTQKAARFR